MKPGPKKGFHPQNEIKKGHVWSKESIQKRSPKIAFTLKSKGIKPPSRRGMMPWNYRGVSRLQERIRKCFEYRQWRSDIFQRDDYTCQHCGKRGVVLNADHIKPFAQILKEYIINTFEAALQCAELWSINNGRTLCEECHHSRKEWDKQLY